MNLVTHALAGWLIAQPLKERKDRALVTAGALVSDLDGLGLVYSVEAYAEYHHVYGHNIFVGSLAALLCAILARERWKCAMLAFVSFHSHIVGDLLGSGAAWPLEYFWPLSRTEYSLWPPFQWELVSWQNTSITAVMMVIVMYIGVKRGRTIVELLSLNTDRKVVDALVNRFGRANQKK